MTAEEVTLIVLSRVETFDTSLFPVDFTLLGFIVKDIQSTSRTPNLSTPVYIACPDIIAQYVFCSSEGAHIKGARHPSFGRAVYGLD